MTHTKLIAPLLTAIALSAASMVTVYAADQTEGAMAGAAKSAAASTDAVITAQVKSALADKAIGVTTSQGVVVLSGQVASTDAGTKAIQTASAVQGVKEVKSELTVASK